MRSVNRFAQASECVRLLKFEGCIIRTKGRKDGARQKRTHQAGTYQAGTYQTMQNWRRQDFMTDQTPSTSPVSKFASRILLAALSCPGVFTILLFVTIAISHQASAQQRPAAGTNGAAANGPASNGEVEVPAGATEINLKNAEISSIIRIFSRKTGRNYILDENVKGKVTIYLPGKIQTGEAIKILDSLLALKGFTSVPIGENLWKIIASKDAKTSTIPTLQGLQGEQPPSAAIVTRILPLKYSSADDVKQLVAPLVSPEGLLNAYTGTNSLIIIDSQDNIDRVVGIIETLDVPSSDREMTIIPVVNAEAITIAEKLNEILGIGSGSGKEGESSSSIDLLQNRVQEGLINTLQRNVNNAGSSASPNFASASRTVTARTREPKITADERTNSIVIVADEETTARVRALISQLDSKLDRSGNKFYVYRCQHASAEELAEVLSSLGGGGGSGSNQGGGAADFFGSSAQDSSRGSLGGRNSGSATSKSRSQSRLADQSRTPGESRRSNQSKSGASSASLGEDISITADSATNSLVIFASKTDYQKVLELLSQLDIKRRQVLVEATLLEVAIDGALATGVSFLGSTGGADGGVIIKNDGNNDLSRLLRDPTSVQNFSAAAASAGSLTLPNGTVIPTQAVLLTAAQSNRNVNVLSAPTILTTDNEEAEIVVGQNVPFVSSTSTSDTNLNNTFNQVDRQDVGITLRLTPQISSGNFVTLKIFTEVSAVVPGTSASTLGPTTTIRTSETTVITKDSQMVVIGGLMSDDTSDGESGIPYLKDIPVLGHLFKQNNSEHRKTNLLIFITPRIIKDQFDHRDATLEARDAIEDQLKAVPSTPNREEVLRRDSLSNIAEGELIDGPKPSTILPPLKESGGDKAGNKADELALKESNRDDNAIELTVKPKAPKNSVTKLSTRSESGLDSMPPPATSSKPLTIEGIGERFVVLELAPGGVTSLATQGNFVGIIIPEGAPPSSEQFFAKGEKITYESTPMRSLGLYASDTAALAAAKLKSKDFPTPSWHRLSPHELLRLGDGIWRKAND